MFNDKPETNETKSENQFYWLNWIKDGTRNVVRQMAMFGHETFFFFFCSKTYFIPFARKLFEKLITHQSHIPRIFTPKPRMDTFG